MDGGTGLCAGVVDSDGDQTMTRPVKVLYVHSSAVLYGSDRALLHLIRFLDRERFQPVVVLPESGPLVPALEVYGVEVHIIPLSILHRSLRLRFWMQFVGRLWTSTRAIVRLIRAQGIGLVHTNTAHVFNGALAARMAGVPHIWHIREMQLGMSRLGGVLSALICRASVTILVISQAVRDAFRWREACGAKVHTIYDGVDTERFTLPDDKRTLREAVGLPPDAALVGMVGRIAHWKGQATFLKAAALVHSQQPQAHFVIVGDAVTAHDHQLKQELVQLTQDLGLAEGVTFTGFRGDVPQIMAALDVFVLPSELPEPWGLVVLEAMASGCPVVATKQGGPLESVLDGETGYLVLPAEPEAMAQALLALLQNPQQAKAMGMAGRARCIEHFPLERAARDVMARYTALLS